MDETKQLTVRQLVELLRSVDQDLPVEVEGCDCYGAAGSIEVMEYAAGGRWPASLGPRRTLLIKRTEEG